MKLYRFAFLCVNLVTPSRPLSTHCSKTVSLLRTLPMLVDVGCHAIHGATAPGRIQRRRRFSCSKPFHASSLYSLYSCAFFSLASLFKLHQRSAVAAFGYLANADIPNAVMLL